MSTLSVSEPFKLYKQKNANNWSVRFSIKGQGQQRRGLGTTDEAEALLKARAIYYGAKEMSDAGLSVTQKLFKDIAEEFAQQIETEVRRGEKEPYHARQFPPVIRRYFIGFFGEMKLTKIKDGDIERYWEWRKEYWLSGDGSHSPFIRYTRTINGRATNIKRPVKEGRPSHSTLHKEAILLRQLFEFALRNGYTLKAPKVELRKPKRRKPTRTPGFTLEQFLHLEMVSRKRVDEFEFNANHKPNKRKKLPDEVQRNQRVYYDRLKLHNFCMFAGYTGLRTTELFNLAFGDVGYREIELDNGLPYNALVLQVRGKAKEREMAAMPAAVTTLNAQRQIFLMQVGRLPKDDDPVFFNNNGVGIRRIGKGLTELLVAAGLRQHVDGRLRDSRSFRHFYITQQVREGVNHHVLGRNTGTSVKMIDEVYSHAQATDEIKGLIPDWMKRTPNKRLF